jgi:zinc transport system substrate-binding protein
MEDGEMVKRLGVILVTLLLGVALLVGCGPSATPEPSATRTERATLESTRGEPNRTAGPLNVTVSILPQKYFVERIGGEHVVVNVMVEPGASPATYEPKAEQLTALSQAATYLSIGVPFEKAWLDKIASANDEMLMVDTAAGIERIPIDAHYKVELGGRPESEAEGRDPHIWLSPELVKIQAQNIYTALAELDPANEVEYKTNLESFLADIDELIADIEETLERISSRKFMVFHPAWGYFGDDFELEMIPIEVGGQEPSAAELAELITTAKEEGIQVIFAQPEFSTKDAGTIAKEISGEVLLISPLAPDWLDNLRWVAKTFAEVLSQ